MDSGVLQYASGKTFAFLLEHNAFAVTAESQELLIHKGCKEMKNLLDKYLSVPLLGTTPVILSKDLTIYIVNYSRDRR